MFSPCPRKHYLNITPANIVKIYAPGGVVDQQPVVQYLLHAKLSGREFPSLHIIGKINNKKKNELNLAGIGRY